MAASSAHGEPEERRTALSRRQLGNAPRKLRSSVFNLILFFFFFCIFSNFCIVIEEALFSWTIFGFRDFSVRVVVKF